jgi:hypothetical protein
MPTQEQVYETATVSDAPVGVAHPENPLVRSGSLDVALTSDHTAVGALRGVVGFQHDGAPGTLTVTEGDGEGFVRLNVYYREGGAAVIRDVEMEAEVREAWLKQIAPASAARSAQAVAVVAQLAEIAAIPGQHSVRVAVREAAIA